MTTADLMKLAAALPPERREALMLQLRSKPAETAAHAKAKLPRRVAGVPNKTEAAFGRHLEFLKNAGEVRWFAYEPIRLKLAKRLTYCPDYVVEFADGHTELLEVKGAKGDRYYCRETSRAKVKMAAHLYGWPVSIVWPLKGGGWGREEFGKER